MRKVSSLIVFCAILFASFPYQVHAQISAEAKQAFRETKIRIFDQAIEATNFSLPLLGGGTMELSAYKGKVVFLNFWATWCPPCRAEMPSMEVLYQRFKNQGLEILAVNGGEDPARVRKFIQDNRYTYPVPVDRNNRVGSLYGIEAIPTSFILDRKGMIIGKLVGSIHWDDPKVLAAFDALLQQ
ncbi:MAG: TlpA family protein disulfide reductase [Treponema sp.]|nr:TlpA family protein disulfide reductase [Treponema sp.]